jgi:predicted ferric reductase
MLRTAIQGTAWLAFYFCAILLPILLFRLGNIPPARTFGIEFGVLLGFGLLLTLAIQFALTARFHWIGKPFGSDMILQMHRHVGILLLIFWFGHPLLLLYSEPKFLEFLDPRVNALRTIFLIIATIAMVLLIVLSVWRKSVGLNYEWWRLSHSGLAVVVLSIGMVHSWQVEHYVAGIGKRALLIAIGGGALGLLAYLRLWRPYRRQFFPYRIVDIIEERGESSTVVLEPVGHEGLKFRSGQYAWLTLGDSPFVMQQNPFSFSSSQHAAPARLEFTAKKLGDFSHRLVEASIGETAFIEGPYGYFCLNDDAPGAVFIMGGIGITPAVSMLRSLRDSSDPRPLLLIYGNSSWKEVAFRRELVELEEALNLRVIHVINEPEADWSGETGYIDRELLDRVLGEAERRFQFFVCGPEPLMDAVERALLQLKIPLHQVRAERFTMV